jgi:hypothetical protein
MIEFADPMADECTRNGLGRQNELATKPSKTAVILSLFEIFRVLTIEMQSS